jgi:hypothetical protein
MCIDGCYVTSFRVLPKTSSSGGVVSLVSGGKSHVLGVFGCQLCLA